MAMVPIIELAEHLWFKWEHCWLVPNHKEKELIDHAFCTYISAVSIKMISVIISTHE